MSKADDPPHTAPGKQLVADIDALVGPSEGESWEAYRRAIRGLVVAGVTKAEQAAHEQGCEDCRD